MVRKERLELSHLAALEPKSSVSTNFTTSAYLALILQFLQWGGRWGSNPRPPESQSGALPTELRPPLQKTFSREDDGTPCRIRTRDLRLRRPLLYPTELRAHDTLATQESLEKVVGVERFELPTSCSQSRRATRLRYTPNILQKRLLAKRRHDTHAAWFRQYFTAFNHRINSVYFLGSHFVVR